MINYLKERISLEEFKEAIKSRTPLEVLCLRDSWTRIEDHVYSDMLKNEEYLLKCYNNWNYRIVRSKDE